MLILAACGPSTKSGNGPGTGGDDDSNTVDAPTQTGDPIDAPGTTAPDAPTCGAQTANIGVVNLGDPPDLLVVLDRSGSMTDFPAVFPPIFETKWNVMEDALKAITVMKDMSIKFGLMDFSSDGNCGASPTPNIPIALGTHTAFTSYYATRTPTGNTPSHLALGAALQYFQSIPVNTAGRYVLFATDGLPNCKGGDPNMTSYPETVAAVQALHDAGIPTYVLGLDSFANTTVLNDAATAGGEAQSGATKYYDASNPTSLAAALQAIAGGIVVPSCTFALASAPPVPDDVTVTINGMAVPRSPSHASGWDYYPDAMTITFFGATCQAIQMGASSAVSFVYGCPGPVIE
jgi:hypothetical protein